MAYDNQLWTNGAETTLAASLAASGAATSVVLAKGTQFPTLLYPGDFFVLSLLNAAGALELLKVTARDGNALTVIRGWEGTTIAAFDIGDSAALDLTAGALQNLQATGWTREDNLVFYLDATHFVVSGDWTTRYTAGRKLRLSQTADSALGSVSSSAYSGGRTMVLTTGVTVDDGLVCVDYGPEVGLFGSVGEAGPTGLPAEIGVDTDAASGTVYNYNAVGNLVRKMLVADVDLSYKTIPATASGGSGRSGQYASAIIDVNNSTGCESAPNVYGTMLVVTFTGGLTPLKRVSVVWSAQAGGAYMLQYLNSSAAWVDLLSLPNNNYTTTTVTSDCNVVASALRLQQVRSDLLNVSIVFEVYRYTQDSLLKYIRATSNSTPILGIATSSTSVKRRGEVQITGKTWTPGARLFAASDATITETFSSTAQCLGVAISADTIKLEPDMAVLPASAYAAGTHSHLAADLPATMPPSAHAHTLSVTTKSGAYTATVNDDVLLCDATAANFAVTLPAASAASTRPLHIKKVDASTHSILVTPAGANTIDAASLYVLSTQYQSVSLMSNGANWYVQ